MTAACDTIRFDWHGRSVSVAFCQDWCKAWCELHGHPLRHLEIRSDDGRALPITETGYRSHFVSGAVIAEWQGVLPYVLAWLDQAAADPAWAEQEAQRAQLCLF